MRYALIFLLCAACGAQPTPRMFGAARYDTTVDGREYVLYRKGNRAEVIRLGWASPGEHAGIRATMIAIIPKLTGCDLIPSSVTGDSGEMRARIICPAS